MLYTYFHPGFMENNDSFLVERIFEAFPLVQL
jgi:hypothetical protein